MEKLNVKYKNFVKSIDNLEQSLIKFFSESVQADLALKEIVIESTIKRFEIAYEICWKYIKLYLETKYSLNLKGSKDSFRECLKLELLDIKTTKELLQILDIRNATSHVYYKFDEIEKLANDIKPYLETFKKVANFLPLENNS